MNRKHERGFIAIVSVIIITVVLLIVVVSASLTGFYSRFNVLDFELKERSAAAAESCANQALLNLAGDPSYTGGSLLSLNSLDSCRVGPVSDTTDTPPKKQFKVQATSSDAVTNLFIVADPDTLGIISWREIANY